MCASFSLAVAAAASLLALSSELKLITGLGPGGISFHHLSAVPRPRGARLPRRANYTYGPDDIQVQLVFYRTVEQIRVTFPNTTGGAARRKFDSLLLRVSEWRLDLTPGPAGIEWTVDFIFCKFYLFYCTI